MGSIVNKTRGQKFHGTVPLRAASTNPSSLARDCCLFVPILREFTLSI
jgi:hypothetical protein